MKKKFLGILAIVLAVVFSAFNTKDNSSDDLYYWFDQTDHSYVGSSATSSGNPLGCTAVGNDCVKGYQRASQPQTEPTGMPDAQFAINP